jgi:hypothetical protein
MLLQRLRSTVIDRWVPLIVLIEVRVETRFNQFRFQTNWPARSAECPRIFRSAGRCENAQRIVRLPVNRRLVTSGVASNHAQSARNPISRRYCRPSKLMESTAA